MGTIWCLPSITVDGVHARIAVDFAWCPKAFGAGMFSELNFTIDTQVSTAGGSRLAKVSRAA